MSDSPAIATQPIIAITLLTLAFAAGGSAGEVGPTLSKVFTPNVIGPGSVATATFTITNNSSTPVTDLAFADVLPTVPGDVDIADPANASTDCHDAVLTAPDGGSTITLSDGSVGAFQSCTVTVDVTAGTPGVHTNPAITLSSSSGSSMSLPIDLTVVTTLPGFSKSFAPSSVPLGGRSTLTFTIDNTANTSRVANLDFTDNLPTGMLIADPANASTDCVSAGLTDTTITADPGTDVITLDADGANIAGFEVLPAGAVCTVTVDVVATGVGALDNVSGDLLADFVSSGRASDTLDATVTPLALTKSFTDDPAPPGGTTTLEFTITNFDRDFPATGVAFTDDLTTMVPAIAGLTFSSLLSNNCGGSVSGVGTTTIGLSGGTLASGGSCTLRVELSVPAGATPGTSTNTTSTITATVDGSPVVGNMASDTLFVESVPILTKEFLEDGTLLPDPVVNAGDDVVLRFTVTNTSATSMATDIIVRDELTDGSGFGGGLSGFLPFPVTVALPPVPDPPCGAGSSLTLISFGEDRQGLELTDGSLAEAGMSGDTCTFEVTLTIPEDLTPAVYLNTTEEPTATIDGATRTGKPASDTLTVIGAPRLTKVFTDDPVAPGGTVTLEFTLEYPAESTGDATDISFTDDLVPVLAGLTATGLPITEACDPDGPGGDPGTGTLSGSAGDTLLTFMGGTLQPGETCTFSVTLDVPVGAAGGSHANTTSGVGATVGGLAATSRPASDDLTIAGLDFTKEFLGDPVLPGETSTLRFTIENIHPTDDATGILFTDSLSTVLPGTPDITTTGPPTVNTCGGTESGSATFLIYSGGSVMTGQTCTIEYGILVPGDATDGTYHNVTSSLTATQSGGTVFVDPAVDTLTINSNLLQLTKEFTDDPVGRGDSVTLEFNLTNLDAGQPASDIDFTDDLGAALPGMTFDSVLLDNCGGTVSGTGTDQISVAGASLGAGASCTIRVSLTVPASAAAGLYVNTTSTVTGSIGGFAVFGDEAIDTLEVLDLLVFSKSFDGPTTATGTATLTFTITNPGTDTATDIAFTDNLDDVIPGLIAISVPAVPCGAGSSISGTSFLTFTAGELPPTGGMCSFDVDVLVPATATAGTFPNTTSDLTRAGLKVADPATADLVVEPPPAFAKAFAPDAILAGGVSTLTFTIDNSASVLTANNLDFTDSLPAGLVVATPPNASTTCTGGTLTAIAGTGTVSYSGGSVGAGATCTVQTDITSIVAGAFVNTTGDLTSSSGNSGTATDTLAVAAAADLWVTKSDGVTSAVPGDSVTYTIVVANSGPSADPSATLSDIFPSPPLTCTYTSAAAGGATGNTAAGAGDLSETLSMPAGSSVTYTATCAIDPDATGTLSNTATVTPSVTDTVPGNNTATDNDTALAPSADLAVTKTDGVTSAVPGGSLTYTIVASNSGLSDDPSATLTDTLPVDLSCTFTSTAAGGATGNTAAGSGDLAETLSMPAGSSVTYTLTCTIDPFATGTLSNTATISASVNDPVPGNNSATDDDTVLMPEADLSITKTASDVLVVTPTFTYTLDVTNLGPSDAEAVEATDLLPSGIVFHSSPDGCTEAAGTVTCPFGTIAFNATVARSFVVALDAPWPATIINTATVSSDAFDPDLGNNESTVETALDNTPPVVTDVSTAAGPLSACDTLRDPVTSLQVTIADDLDLGSSVGDPANYLLVGTGPDADFSTDVCVGGAAGDDVPIEIVALSLTSVDPVTVTAGLGLGGALDPGLYRLLVCDTLTDAAGNALDGDGDTIPGGDFVVPFFRADPFNAFVNGHFDDCPVSLDPWLITVTAPNAVLPGTPAVDDSDGSPFSASARVFNSAPDATTLAQCVNVIGSSAIDTQARVRFIPDTDEIATFRLTCEFFDGGMCSGASLGVTSETTLLEDMGGAWLSLSPIVAAPDGAGSALCDFTVESVGPSSDFDLSIDSLFFGQDPRIFSDGFESGDVSAWSSSSP